MFFRSGKKTAQDVSINEPIDTDKDGNALTILDTMATDDTIIENIDIKMKSERLYGFIQHALTPREREIILLRYGLCGHKPLPQRAVSYTHLDVYKRQAAPRALSQLLILEKYAANSSSIHSIT